MSADTLTHPKPLIDHLFLLTENGGKGPKYIHMGQRSSEKEVL